jgi:hypothetical protein
MKTKILILIILSNFFVKSLSQMVYTEYTPSKSVSNTLPLDFNNDSIIDFIFLNYSVQSGACCVNGPVVREYIIKLKALDTAKMIKNSNGDIYFSNYDSIANNLESFFSSNCRYYGEFFGCTDIVYSLVTCDYTQCGDYSYYGLKESVTDKYIVVKFLIKNKYHYGWIKFSKKEGVNMEIKSIAYNIIPKESFRINDPNPTSVLNCSINDEISIYPNPFKNVINVKIKESSFKRLYLTDLLGHKIISQDIKNKQSILNTENLLNGAYFLIIEADNYRATKLLIK